MVTSTAGVAGTENFSTVSSKTKTGMSETQDRFLKLLVTQMKNQDPLNPLDNAQVTSQMAQLSTVSGIEKLNQTLESFTSAQGLQRSFESVGMIGHAVLAPGSTLDLADGAAVGGVELPSDVNKLKVKILDASGVVVQELNLGEQPAGVTMFTWDGTNKNGDLVDDGRYTFRVEAAYDKETVKAVNLAVGEVSSLLVGKDGPSLNVTGLGEVNPADVRQVFPAAQQSL